MNFFFSFVENFRKKSKNQLCEAAHFKTCFLFINNRIESNTNCSGPRLPHYAYSHVLLLYFSCASLLLHLRLSSSSSPFFLLFLEYYSYIPASVLPAEKIVLICLLRRNEKLSIKITILLIMLNAELFGVIQTSV